MSERPPVFVVFEGLDGAGKTTVARRVAATMNAAYLTTPSAAVRVFRDDLIRDFGGSQEAAHLFYLATVFAASREVDALIVQGRSVVLDRYLLSTQAYAEFRGSALRLEEVERHLRPADLTVFLDAPLGIRMHRIVGRRCATAADRETLNLDADTTLRQAHAARSGLPVTGRFLNLDTAGSGPDELVALVLREVGWGRSPPT